MLKCFLLTYNAISSFATCIIIFIIFNSTFFLFVGGCIFFPYFFVEGIAYPKSNKLHLVCYCILIKMDFKLQELWVYTESIVQCRTSKLSLVAVGIHDRYTLWNMIALMFYGFYMEIGTKEGMWTLSIR